MSEVQELPQELTGNCSNEISKEIDGIVPPTKTSFYEKVHGMTERFAATRFGQFLIDRSDRCLRAVEDTAKWSLPAHRLEPKYQRTLTWIPFLLIIIVLRFLRIWLSFGAICIGNGPVSTRDLIQFIEARRRKLRAIRIHGRRAIRYREMGLNGVTSKYIKDQCRLKISSNFISRAIYRPRTPYELTRRQFIKDQLLTESEMQQSSDISDDASDSQQENSETNEIDQVSSLPEIFTKYANENSDEESYFKLDNIIQKEDIAEINDSAEMSDYTENSDDTEMSDLSGSEYLSEEIYKTDKFIEESKSDVESNYEC